MGFIYHINSIHTLLKELYAVFVNLKFCFYFDPLSTHCWVWGSSIWTVLKLCWGTSLTRKIYVISCLLHVMAHYPKNFFQDKWLVSSNGGCYFSGQNKITPAQIVDITDILLLEELRTFDYYILVLLEHGSIKPQTQLLYLLHKFKIWCSPLIPD